jgi:hypothetical protein
MRLYLSICCILVALSGFSQDKPGAEKPKERRLLSEKVEEAPKAPIDQYRIVTLDRDTTYVDTSLTLKKEYEFNYLRKDIFGLMPFANEGQTYNTLQYGLTRMTTYPEFGRKAKHFNYLEAEDVRYYSVATPLTELYFKSVMEQGQTLDAFLTVNTSERLNMSIAYKGLRSLGKYINQLSSTGNFRFTTSYFTKDERYLVNLHFVSQDMLNGENGGIVSDENFESEDAAYKNRARLEVYFKDAESFLKGYRGFVDHAFRINGTKGSNNLYVTHQFNYERKFFEYSQPTVVSTITDAAGETYRIQRYGEAFVPSGIIDQVRYNRMYNKAGLVYENTTLGRFGFFADDFRYNYYYGRIITLDGNQIPSSLNDEINSVGGQYEYGKGKWKGKVLYTVAVNGPATNNAEASATFQINDKNQISFKYQNQSKLPDHIYNLHQSSYRAYNWYNDFENVKINAFEAVAETQWLTASVQLRSIKDQLYFSNDEEGSNDTVQIVTPKQSGEAINYLSVKVGREFRFGKFALDNTFLYQKVDQENDVLNVPQFVTRNTLYYSNHFFKRALYIQTGVTFNYFTKYYANEYNPMLGEFFVQQQKEIGNFPMLDFFINARVRQTRFFLKAEHFNSMFTGNDFYSAPHYPYRDFMIRFGLVWNFFQ